MQWGQGNHGVVPENVSVVPVRFDCVRVWQYNDPGDVKGVLTDDIDDNFDKKGQPWKK